MCKKEYILQIKRYNERIGREATPDAAAVDDGTTPSKTPSGNRNRKRDAHVTFEDGPKLTDAIVRFDDREGALCDRIFHPHLFA